MLDRHEGNRRFRGAMSGLAAPLQAQPAAVPRGRRRRPTAAGAATQPLTAGDTRANRGQGFVHGRACSHLVEPPSAAGGAAAAAGAGGEFGLLSGPGSTAAGGRTASPATEPPRSLSPPARGAGAPAGADAASAAAAVAARARGRTRPVTAQVRWRAGGGNGGGSGGSGDDDMTRGDGDAATRRRSPPVAGPSSSTGFIGGSGVGGFGGGLGSSGSLSGTASASAAGPNGARSGARPTSALPLSRAGLRPIDTASLMAPPFGPGSGAASGFGLSGDGASVSPVTDGENHGPGASGSGFNSLQGWGGSNSSLYTGSQPSVSGSPARSRRGRRKLVLALYDLNPETSEEARAYLVPFSRGDILEVLPLPRDEDVRQTAKTYGLIFVRHTDGRDDSGYIPRSYVKRVRVGAGGSAGGSVIEGSIGSSGERDSVARRADGDGDGDDAHAHAHGHGDADGEDDGDGDAMGGGAGSGDGATTNRPRPTRRPHASAAAAAGAGAGAGVVAVEVSRGGGNDNTGPGPRTAAPTVAAGPRTVLSSSAGSGSVVNAVASAAGDSVAGGSVAGGSVGGASTPPLPGPSAVAAGMGRLAVALYSFAPDAATVAAVGGVDFDEGEQLMLVAPLPLGLQTDAGVGAWVQATNARGQTGGVPSTYLNVVA
jgi:hypothetical protein